MITYPAPKNNKHLIPYWNQSLKDLLKAMGEKNAECGFQMVNLVVSVYFSHIGNVKKLNASLDSTTYIVLKNI